MRIGPAKMMILTSQYGEPTNMFDRTGGWFQLPTDYTKSGPQYGFPCAEMETWWWLWRHYKASLYIYVCVINVIAIRDSHRMLPSIFGYVWHRISLKKLQVGRSACFIPAHSAPRHRRESTGFDRCHRRPQRDHDLRDVRQLVRSIMGGCTKVVFQATISMLVGGMLAHQFT